MKNGGSTMGDRKLETGGWRLEQRPAPTVVNEKIFLFGLYGFCAIMKQVRRASAGSTRCASRARVHVVIRFSRRRK